MPWPILGIFNSFSLRVETVISFVASSVGEAFFVASEEVRV